MTEPQRLFFEYTMPIWKRISKNTNLDYTKARAKFLRQLEVKLNTKINKDFDNFSNDEIAYLMPYVDKLKNEL